MLTLFNKRSGYSIVVVATEFPAPGKNNRRCDKLCFPGKHIQAKRSTQCPEQEEALTNV